MAGALPDRRCSCCNGRIDIVLKGRDGTPTVPVCADCDRVKAWPNTERALNRRRNK